jgi:hypothetical protein
VPALPFAQRRREATLLEDLAVLKNTRDELLTDLKLSKVVIPRISEKSPRSAFKSFFYSNVTYVQDGQSYVIFCDILLPKVKGKSRFIVKLILGWNERPTLH